MRVQVMKYILAILICLWASGAWGATYYVRADGDNSDPDCSEGDPCCAEAMDGSDFNAGSFSAGDIIKVCDDGGVIRSQLTVPSSGSSGNPITIEAADGDSPVISGADISTSYSGISVERLTNGTLESWTSATDADNWTEYTSGTSTVNRESANQRTGTYGMRFDVDGSGSLVYADTTFTLSAGTSCTLSFYHYESGSAALRYFIENTDNGKRLQSDGSWTTNQYLFSTGHADSYTEVSKAFTSDAAGNYVLRIERHYNNDNNESMYIDDVSLLEESTVIFSKGGITTEPKQVFYNSVRLTENDGATTGVVTDEWDWDSNTLYVNVGEDPDNGTLEIGQRDYCIYVLFKNYVTIDGIDVKHANVQNIRVWGSTNSTIQSLQSSYAYGDSIRIQGESGATCDSWLIDGVTADHNGNNGARVGIYSPNGTVQNSTFNHNAQFQNEDFLAGFRLVTSPDEHARTSSAIIANNLVYKNGYNDADEETGTTNRGYGIWLDTSASGSIVRYNLVRDNLRSGVFVENSDSPVVIGNISHSNGEYGFRVDSSVTSLYTQNALIYNNTSYGNADAACYAAGVYQETGSDTYVDNIWKNNICFGSDNNKSFKIINGAQNDSDANGRGTGNVYESNALGTEQSNFIEWGIEAYWSTYDTFISGSSQTDNNVESDPSLTNAAGDDFTLTSDSPCVDAGVNLGLTYQNALGSDSSWPSSVVTVNQNNYGNWDIGAYGDKGGSLYFFQLIYKWGM